MTKAEWVVGIWIRFTTKISSLASRGNLSV